MDQIYVINLKRRPDRKEAFEKHHAALMPHVKFVEAVDGQTAILPENTHISDGAAGCFYSHIKVWEAIAEGASEWAIVTEDDVKINAAGLLREWPYIKRAMAKHGVLLGVMDWRSVGGHAERVLKVMNARPGILTRLLAPHRVVPQRVKDLFFGTHFYATSRRGAREMLQVYERHGPIPVDVIMAEKSVAGIMAAHYVVPLGYRGLAWVENPAESETAPGKYKRRRGKQGQATSEAEEEAEAEAEAET